MGAYVINKAVASQGRPVTQSESGDKRTKDLLYLRDLMAAGPEVVQRIADELMAMAGSDPVARQQIVRAHSVLQALKPAETDAAAEMLAERDRITHPDARFDVTGHLSDLTELVEESVERVNRSHG